MPQYLDPKTVLIYRLHPVQEAQLGPIHFKCRKNIYILIACWGLFLSLLYNKNSHILQKLFKYNKVPKGLWNWKENKHFLHILVKILGFVLTVFLRIYSLIEIHENTTMFMYEYARFNCLCYKRSIFNRGPEKLFECVLSSPRALVEQLPSDVPVNNIAISSYAAFSLSYQENVFLKSKSWVLKIWVIFFCCTCRLYTAGCVYKWV
jgi:hypothetical protein